MPFTAAIVIVVLSYTSAVERHVAHSFAYVPVALVVTLTVWHGLPASRAGTLMARARPLAAPFPVVHSGFDAADSGRAAPITAVFEM
jgi:hypothetical protein